MYAIRGSCDSLWSLLTAADCQCLWRMSLLPVEGVILNDFFLDSPDQGPRTLSVNCIGFARPPCYPRCVDIASSFSRWPLYNSLQGRKSNCPRKLRLFRASFVTSPGKWWSLSQGEVSQLSVINPCRYSSGAWILSSCAFSWSTEPAQLNVEKSAILTST